MGFSRQEYYSGLPFPPSGDLPHPGIKPTSLMSPALAGAFVTTSATWEALLLVLPISQSSQKWKARKPKDTNSKDQTLESRNREGWHTDLEDQTECSAQWNLVCFIIIPVSVFLLPTWTEVKFCCSNLLSLEVFIACACMHAELLQLCSTLCDPMNSSPLGSSVHGISQARILEWVTITFSRGSSWPRDQTCVKCVSCIARQILYHYTTWETMFFFFSLLLLKEGFCLSHVNNRGSAG